MFRNRWRHQRARAEAQSGDDDRKAAGPILGTLLATRQRGDVRALTGPAASSLIVHAVVIGGLVWATMAGSTDAPPEPPVVVELIVNAAPPPPPPPPVNLPTPIAPVDIADGFIPINVPDVVLPEIPPPVFGVVIREEDFSGTGREGGIAGGRDGAPTLDELIAAPRIVPFTVRPELRNSADVMEALTRFYPPLLRDAGIGGQTLMWFFIDENGRVLKTQVKEASGYAALDQAAERVAGIMQFSPAQNLDKRVQVWIEIPIVFKSK